MLNGLFAGNNHLKNTDNAASKCILIIVLRVYLFQSLEGFNTIVEVPHFIAIISYQLQ